MESSHLHQKSHRKRNSLILNGATGTIGKAIVGGFTSPKNEILRSEIVRANSQTVRWPTRTIVRNVSGPSERWTLFGRVRCRCSEFAPLENLWA